MNAVPKACSGVVSRDDKHPPVSSHLIDFCSDISRYNNTLVN